MDTSQPIATLSGHTDGVMGLQFDAHTIVSGSLDGTIQIWDMPTVRSSIESRELLLFFANKKPPTGCMSECNNTRDGKENRSALCDIQVSFKLQKSLF